MNPPAKPIATSPNPPAEPVQGQLGVFDAMNIIVGIVIGTVIFKTAPTIFSFSGSPANALVIWALGGVLAFIGALCYAELATSYPRDGGDYVYLTKAFGPWAGFLFGWAQLIIVLTCSIGAMATVFGEYATNLYDLTQHVQFAGLSSLFLYAAGAIVVITLLNIVGVVLGKWTQNLLTILKICGVIAIVVAGFGWGDWTAHGASTWTAPQFNSWGLPSVALILVMYAYGGWNDAAFVAAEVRDPRRNIPRALLLGVGVIMIAYLLINLAYLIGIGFDAATHKNIADGEHKPLIPLLVLQRAFGDVGDMALSAVIMISALGAVNGLIFTGARVYGTLGKDHRLFSWLGHWKPGRGAPVMALLVQGIITLSMVAAFGTVQGEDTVNVVLGKISAAGNAIYGHEPDSPDALKLRIKVSHKKTDAPPPPKEGEGDVPAAPAGQDEPEGERFINPEATFDKLFAISAPFFWVFFLATGLSLFVLRKPKEERPFSVPLYPILPIIFCNVCAWMIYRTYDYVANDPFGPKLAPVFVVFVILVLLGLPIYWVSSRIGYRDSAEEK